MILLWRKYSICSQIVPTHPEFISIQLNGINFLALCKVLIISLVWFKLHRFAIQTDCFRFSYFKCGRIAKSLSFGVGEGYIVIVTAGDCKIDNAKYKAKFHAKARMLTPPEVEEHIGHAVGGVCPFGVNDGVAVYLDESLRRFGTVFPACGSSNSAIELTIEELERYSRCAEWVDVCKRIGQ